jgi:hypothetical protein
MSKKINISNWVAKSKNNPNKYALRQVIEILINAIGHTKFLKGNMYLKGGTLMALAHESQRMTGDVDFSWLEPFHKDDFRDVDEIIRESLDESMNMVRNKLGYLDLRCKVQTIKKMPNGWRNNKLSTPALEMTIGFAKIGTRQAELLEINKSVQILRVDISFNEKIKDYEELILDDGSTSINAYSPIEIITEKYRALIQQAQRNHERNRRQDVYDINFLIKHFDYDEDEKKLILENLIIKSESRNIYPNYNSLSDMKVKELAKKEWHTMELELMELPDFEGCYENIKNFYMSLPWDKNKKNPNSPTFD